MTPKKVISLINIEKIYPSTGWNVMKIASNIGFGQINKLWSSFHQYSLNIGKYQLISEQGFFIWRKSDFSCIFHYYEETKSPNQKSSSGLTMEGWNKICMKYYLNLSTPVLAIASKSQSWANFFTISKIGEGL